MEKTKLSLEDQPSFEALKMRAAYDNACNELNALGELEEYTDEEIMMFSNYYGYSSEHNG